MGAGAEENGVERAYETARRHGKIEKWKCDGWAACEEWAWSGGSGRLRCGTMQAAWTW
jgi:hypothetical protein